MSCVPCRRDASSTRIVPIVLISAVAHGVIDRARARPPARRDGSRPRDRAPRTRRPRRPRRARRPRRTWPNAFRFSRACPVERSSSTSTESPRSTSASTRCEPMKPAPPVTRARTAANPTWPQSGTRSLIVRRTVRVTRNPLWRRAPFVLSRFPGIAAALVGGAALLAVASAAGPALRRLGRKRGASSRSSTRSRPTGPGSSSRSAIRWTADRAGSVAPPSVDERTRAFDEEAREDPGPRPDGRDRARPARRRGEPRAPEQTLDVRLLSRTDALDHVQVVDGGGRRRGRSGSPTRLRASSASSPATRCSSARRPFPSRASTGSSSTSPRRPTGAR